MLPSSQWVHFAKKSGTGGKKEFSWLQSEGRAFERVSGHDVLRETVLYRVRG